MLAAAAWTWREEASVYPTSGTPYPYLQRLWSRRETCGTQVIAFERGRYGTAGGSVNLV